MNATRITAILLIVAGTMGLIYGGFNYTSDVHRADVGPLHMSVAEKEYFNIPVWAGVAFILVGGVLLVVRNKT
jgi:uncharacterized membrane protein YdcZ (DUF606 family)